LTLPAIQCVDLTRHYGEVKAVEGLNFSVQKGSIFGFLGRNGAGKTTTIRMLTGLAQPDRGRGWVSGIETTAADSQARRLFGYLPQNPAFYNWMTPLDYLKYSASLFELSKNDTRQRIQEVLELVDLTQARNRRIGGFSGGMLQRMGIAQALVHSPSVLFLDEPTSALDPAGRYEVLELISRLRGQVTVFLSSHILSDIERVCDTIAILRSGELVIVAPRDHLLNEYTSSTAVISIEPGKSFSPGFLDALRQQPWVLNVSLEVNQVRVYVDQVEPARLPLLMLTAQHEVPVDRYEWTRPTLEEIFLKLSA